MALIEILCDGNEKLGYGHIRRSQTLAAQLAADGFQVRLKGLSDAASQMLPEAEYRDEAADLILFDSLLDIDTDIREARKQSVPIVTLDYFGPETPDINVVVYPHQTPRAKWPGGVHVGFEYVLIRPDIVLEKPNVRPISSQHDHVAEVLVCIGGSDLLGQSHLAGSVLARVGAKVTVVQGPFARPFDVAGKYDVVVSPKDLPQRFSHCDLAVTNGGGCLFEALYFGRPVHVLPQTDAEERVSLALDEMGLLLGRGLESLRLYGADERCAVAERASRGPIDGMGAVRISAILKEALGHG